MVDDTASVPFTSELIDAVSAEGREFCVTVDLKEVLVSETTVLVSDLESSDLERFRNHFLNLSVDELLVAGIINEQTIEISWTLL